MTVSALETVVSLTSIFCLPGSLPCDASWSNAPGWGWAACIRARKEKIK